MGKFVRFEKNGPSCPCESDVFILPVSEEEGQSKVVNVEIPQSLNREMEEMLNSSRYPFYTKDQVMRWALHRHLHYLHRLEPDIPGLGKFLKQEDRRIRAWSDAQEMKKWRQALKGMREVVNHWVSRGETSEARRWLTQMRKELEGVPDSFWREFTLADLDNNFRHLLEKH